jgi:hypothetical protein
MRQTLEVKAFNVCQKDTVIVNFGLGPLTFSDSEFDF